MLDDENELKQHDAWQDLELASLECEQVKFETVINNGDHDNRLISSIVVAGMGGSALAAAFIKTWLKSELKAPFEVVRSYDLPESVNTGTLVIASSYSGNTEETVSCLAQAKAKGAQIAIIASGGNLIDQANVGQIANIVLPTGHQPRMAMIAQLRSIIAILEHFGLTATGKLDEIASKYDWLKSECAKWSSEVPTSSNYAKQLASQALGKTAVFFCGTFSYPVAYKWKTCWNETAKNLAFLCEFPEFNHNEILGWTSHPIEKPFAIFDIISNLEHPQILKRFEISDRLLSGQRPKSTVINLAGNSAIEQLLWGSILADFASIYLAALNGISPMSVELIEKLKKELA
jgi:glucose/mannose-6-phosphate isomerase